MKHVPCALSIAVRSTFGRRSKVFVKRNHPCLIFSLHHSKFWLVSEYIMLTWLQLWRCSNLSSRCNNCYLVGFHMHIRRYVDPHVDPYYSYVLTFLSVWILYNLMELQVLNLESFLNEWIKWSASCYLDLALLARGIYFQPDESLYWLFFKGFMIWRATEDLNGLRLHSGGDRKSRPEIIEGYVVARDAEELARVRNLCSRWLSFLVA